MIQIKSTVPLIYDSRNQAAGIIVIELIGFSYDPRLKRYLMTVVNSVQTEEGLIPISTTTPSPYLQETIDGLFYVLENPIAATDSFTEKLHDNLHDGLLRTTQTQLHDDGTTAYGGLPEQWVKVVTN